MKFSHAVILGMPYAHFLVSLEGGEEEVRLNRFLNEHAVLKIDQKLVDRGGESNWA